MFNGGGYVYPSNGSYGFGGGSTDIRTIQGAWNNASSLRSRIIVAAGGGGGKYDEECYAGAAGGLSGINGIKSETNWWKAYDAGYGGNQTAAGRLITTDQDLVVGGFGYGGSGKGGSWGGGGGGSGWYGGSGSYVQSGGGGSSYISGHTGAVAVTSTSSSSPKSGCTTGTTNNNCSISPYGYTFTNTVMIDGAGYKWTNTKGSLQAMPKPSGGNYASGVGHTGSGYAKITWLGV